MKKVTCSGIPCRYRLGETDDRIRKLPFEPYLDFGVQIKVRSPATHTFLVQLEGTGTYVPSPRSVYGGGYGSVSASNLIGPEGGQQLAELTVRSIRAVWEL